MVWNGRRIRILLDPDENGGAGGGGTGGAGAGASDDEKKRSKLQTRIKELETQLEEAETNVERLTGERDTAVRSRDRIKKENADLKGADIRKSAIDKALEHEDVKDKIEVDRPTLESWLARGFNADTLDADIAAGIKQFGKAIPDAGMNIGSRSERKDGDGGGGKPKLDPFDVAILQAAGHKV